MMDVTPKTKESRRTIVQPIPRIQRRIDRRWTPLRGFDANSTCGARLQFPQSLFCFLALATRFTNSRLYRPDSRGDVLFSAYPPHVLYGAGDSREWIVGHRENSFRLHNS